jgi:hypothetical protein
MHATRATPEPHGVVKANARLPFFNDPLCDDSRGRSGSKVVLTFSSWQPEAATATTKRIWLDVRLQLEAMEVTEDKSAVLEAVTHPPALKFQGGAYTVDACRAYVHEATSSKQWGNGA